MTENEAIKLGKDLYENITINANNIIPTKKYVEFVKMANEALEEIQQYRAIGTVEELKAYKQGNCTNDCKHYDSAIEYMRNKAIDEFAERLKDLIAKNVEDAEISDDLCCEIFQSEIDEIAEQLKAGGMNES